MKRVNCILLIDDDEATNEYHKIIIRKAAVCDHIRIAVDGEQALQYLRTAAAGPSPEANPRPDIIFLDINMPRMNGFEFLSEYERLEERLKGKVVIIMLTTSLNPEDKTRALGFQFVNEFRRKPLTVESIQEAINRYF